MSTAGIQDNTATDLAAFDLGALSSSFMWSFDLAAFALSSRNRNEISTKIVQLTAQVVNFPITTPGAAGSAGAPVSDALTSVSRLSVVLNKADAFLRELDCEWFQNAASNAEEFAARSEGETAWGELYYQEMRHHVPAIRGELHDAIIDDVLSTDRQRLMYRLGSLIDEGMHDPEVARHVFDVVDLNASNADSIRSLQALWSSPPPPDLLQQRFDQINRHNRIDYQLRTFPNGKPPLKPGREREGFTNWINRVQASAESFGLHCEPPEPLDAVSPESAVRVAQQFINTIRAVLVARSTPACSSITAEVVAPTTLCSSPSGSDSEVGTATTTSVEQANVVIADNSFSTGSDNNRLNRDTEDEPVQTTQLQNESQNDNAERIGNWSFMTGDVQFKQHEPFALTGQGRKLLKRLLQNRLRNDGQPYKIAWTDISTLWGDYSDIEKGAVITAICRLSTVLKTNLKAACPEDPIPSSGEGLDLCYWLDPSLM